MPVVTVLHTEIKKNISIVSVIFIFPKFESELAQANLRVNYVC